MGEWVSGWVGEWVGGWSGGGGTYRSAKNEKSILWWMINHDFCCSIYLMTILNIPI